VPKQKKRHQGQREERPAWKTDTRKKSNASRQGWGGRVTLESDLKGNKEAAYKDSVTLGEREPRVGGTFQALSSIRNPDVLEDIAR